MTFCEQLQFNAKILKSTGQLLTRNVLGICKHRPPAALEINNVTGKFSELQHCLIMRPTDCPCCAARSWWRADVSKIVALARRVADLESQGWTVADRDGYYGREFSLHPSVFELSLVSTFTSMAHAIADTV